MTANDIITRLTTPNCQTPGWVNLAAITVCPRPPGAPLHYESTQARFFTEVTVRLPAMKTAKRSGQQYNGLQRRRIDLVAVIKANIYNYHPIIAGIEIKVSEHDLLNDSRITDYLPYCDLFYLAVPAHLRDAAIIKRQIIGYDKVGLLVIYDDVIDHAHPNPQTPSDAHLKEICAELLIKPFRDEK